MGMSWGVPARSGPIISVRWSMNATRVLKHATSSLTYGYALSIQRKRLIRPRGVGGLGAGGDVGLIWVRDGE